MSRKNTPARGHVRVSDHALVRALERICGLPVEELRLEIERSLAQTIFAAQKIGGGRYLIVAGGITYVVSDGDVITVVGSTTPKDNKRMLSETRGENRGREG